MKLTALTSTFALEHEDEFDLYLIVGWRHREGDWTAEVFVNGGSITRLHDEFKSAILVAAKDVIANEKVNRRIG